MSDPDLVADIVKALDIDTGSTERRPVHTIGIGATGYFKPSAVAPKYCIAEHFNTDRTNVAVRFSNGSGSIEEHDGWNDVRGMAVRFYLQKNPPTDLVAMTLPEFFAPTPKDFLQFARAARPARCERQSAWTKIKEYLKLQLPMPDPYEGQTERPDEGAIGFANDHLWAQPAVLNASAIGAPVSYVRAAYHAVHTFIVKGGDGNKRPVRFTWQPIKGVLNTVRTHSPDDDYLKDDLRKRISKAPQRFSLMMMIGEIGDKFDDPTLAWPPHRTRINMGTLRIDDVPEDQEKHSEKLSFNPWLTTKGIDPSGDPILKIRKDVYEYSSKRRHAIPCPFGDHGRDDK